MTQPAKLPLDLSIGMKIVTNERYAKVYSRSTRKLTGVISGPTASAEGCCMIHLEGHKRPHPLHRKLFEIVT